MTGQHKIVAEAHLMGNFSLTIGEKTISCKKRRPTLVWLLLAILLYSHEKPLQEDELIRALWKYEVDGTDTMNALKNLVYRTRELLCHSFGSEAGKYILFDCGTYCWSPALETHTDVDHFQRLNQVIRMTHSVTEKGQLCKEAMHLYAGPFLPGVERSTDVQAIRHKLEDRYAECTAAMCGVLEQQNQTDNLPEFCLEALKRAPLNLQLHRLTIFCYLKAERYSEALSYYNQVTALFYREKGQDISPELRDLYRLISKNFRHAPMDISSIRDELQEPSQIQSAYFCDFEAFRNLYRVDARVCMLSHQPATIVLMTLAKTDGSLPERGSVIREQNALKSAAMSSLRSGDVITSYSDTQFLLLLPQTNLQQAGKAVEKILKSYHKLCRNKYLQVLHKMMPVKAAPQVASSEPAETNEREDSKKC